MVAIDELHAQLTEYLGRYRGKIPEDLIAFEDEVNKFVHGRQPVHPNLSIILLENEWRTIDSLVECYQTEVPGHVLLGRVGRGGFGVIYKAVNERGKLRAIKIEDRTEGEKVKYAYYIFGKEGLAKMEELPDAFRHQNIIKYYDKGVLEDRRVYHVLEWIEGWSLDEVVEWGKKKSLYETEGINKKQFMNYMMQILSALKNINRSHSHNDLRLANIMVDKDGLVTIIDFGIATELDENGIAKEGKNISSRRIAAPESIQRGELSIRTDIRALGILMYHMLTGEHPFPHSNPDELEKIVTNNANYKQLSERIYSSKSIPNKLKPIIEKCLAYDPKKRYQSVDELAAELQPKRKRRRLPWIAGAAACVACAGFLYFSTVIYQSNRREIEAAKQVIKSKITAGVKVFDTVPRKIKRDPRILLGDEDSFEYCKRHHQKDKKVELCIRFRDAEKLLDEGRYARAARVLEDLVKEDSRKCKVHAALVEAYFELGYYKEAQKKLEDTKKNCQGYMPWELDGYSKPINNGLQNYPLTFSLSDEEECHIPSIKNMYPECNDFVKAFNAEGRDDKEAAYHKIIAEYPYSFFTYRELAGIVFKKGTVQEQEDGSIVYGNIDTINEALSYYYHVVKIIGKKGAIFYKIGMEFSEGKNNNAVPAFVFFYRANKEGYNAEQEMEAALNKVLSIGSTPKASRFDFVRHPERSKQEYERLSKLCTTGEFAVKSFSWR